LVTVIVYVVDVPAVTDATPSDFVIERSAVLPTVVLCDPELLPGTGSAVVALTVAVFVYVPPGVAALTVTFTVIVQVAEAASVGLVHVTTLPTFPQEPAPDETPVTVNWAGTVSDTVSVDASDGPLFVTVSV
jgi:hypothetical protein